jgi:hypothetical protein
MVTTHADTTSGNLWFQNGGSQSLENVSLNIFHQLYIYSNIFAVLGIYCREGSQLLLTNKAYHPFSSDLWGFLQPKGKHCRAEENDRGAVSC